MDDIRAKRKGTNRIKISLDIWWKWALIDAGTWINSIIAPIPQQQIQLFSFAKSDGWLPKCNTLDVILVRYSDSGECNGSTPNKIEF